MLDAGEEYLRVMRDPKSTPEERTAARYREMQRQRALAESRGH